MEAVLVLRTPLILICLGAALAASAQTPAKPEGADLERAQKQADAVFKWIRFHADKSADKAVAPKPAAPVPAPAPAPAARRPSPAPAPALATAPPPSGSPAATATNPVAATPVQAEPPAAPPATVAAASPSPAPSPAVQAAIAATEPPPAPEPEPEPETPLKIVSRVEPIIPRQLTPSLRTGFAQVRFTVEPDGRVSTASVIKASQSRLGIAAVEAVKQWRFEPIKTAREVGIEFGFNNE